MDTRIALKEGTVLESQGRGFSYQIKHEIARGGSCIVYHAVYQTEDGEEKAVRLKECYPFHLNIRREADGRLFPACGETDAFEQVKDNLRKAFRDGNSLFMTVGLTNATANMLQYLEVNDTIYIPTAYMEGETLTAASFSSMKDCIRIVTTIAQVIEQIHKAGYLYLDLKPENVFVITNAEGKGATELVQLFDFDSLVEVDCLNNSQGKTVRLSYTHGYAALEHQMGQFHKLGYYSDVFSLGALLFYLVFGRPPKAMDCEEETEYNYARSKYGEVGFQDRFLIRLTDFFHHTLASYRFDRFQTMGEVIPLLKELAELSDRTVPYILSSKIIAEKRFVGRKKEMDLLNQWIQDASQSCLFLTGMGGIGKSSIVRQYLSTYEDQLDSVLYLYFQGSVRNTVIDDFYLQINTVEQGREENSKDYFSRKLRELRKLVHGKKVLLVLDDFSGEITKDFLDLLNVGWKVLVVSRKRPPSDNYPHILVKAFADMEVKCELFQNYLGRYLQEEEKEEFRYIAEKTEGHTLILELLAKQIGSQKLTMKEANRLMDKMGVSDFGEETVRYEKDNETRQETIRNIISAVFYFHHQEGKKERILKILSLFQPPGVSKEFIIRQMKLAADYILTEMQQEGWLRVTEDRIILHPVVKEAVLSWKWKEEDIEEASWLLKYLFRQLKFICSREDAASIQHPVDPNSAKRLLQISEAVLESCRKQTQLRNEKAYLELFSLVLLRIPVEKEDFILQYMWEVIHHPLQKNKVRVMSLYKRWIMVLLERGEQNQARDIIEEIRRYARGKNALVLAGYYDILGEFYDARLNGAYHCDNEERDLQRLLRSVDQAAFYLKWSTRGEKQKELCSVLFGKMNILIRSNPEQREEIEKLIEEIEVLLNGLENHPEVLRDYCMSLAWYHVYVCPYEDRVKRLCSKAAQLALITCVTDLEYLEMVVIPYANMMAELGNTEATERILEHGIRICEKHVGLLPYLRKREEIEQHLQEIWQEETLSNQNYCQ